MWDAFVQGILELNRGVLSAWPVSAVSTFVLVQRIKRGLLSVKISLGLLETEGLAFAICTLNSMLWMTGLWGIALKEALIHTWFIATTYVATIKFIMERARIHQPEVYQALKTKRRHADFDGFATLPDAHAEKLRDTQ
jgi:hypothetical protein